jgi:hypothetical protein
MIIAKIFAAWGDSNFPILSFQKRAQSLEKFLFSHLIFGKSHVGQEKLQLGRLVQQSSSPPEQSESVHRIPSLCIGSMTRLCGSGGPHFDKAILRS